MDEIDVKTPLTTMKQLLHTKWIMNLYDEITSKKKKEIALNGWKAAGILGAVEMGSTKLKFFDPFNGIDPLGGDPGNVGANERYESDSDNEYVLKGKQHAFDAVM